MSFEKLIHVAESLGSLTGENYREEHGVAAKDADRSEISCWIATEWPGDWEHLKMRGAEESDHNEYLNAWRSHFLGCSPTRLIFA